MSYPLYDLKSTQFWTGVKNSTMNMIAKYMLKNMKIIRVWWLICLLAKNKTNIMRIPKKPATQLFAIKSNMRMTISQNIKINRNRWQNAALYVGGYGAGPRHILKSFLNNGCQIRQVSIINQSQSNVELFFIKQVFISNNLQMGCGAVHNPQASQPFSKRNQSQHLDLNKKIQKHVGSTNKVENAALKLSQKETMDRVYEIKQLLGKGTYGQVYRCIKTQTGEQFALKIIKLNAKNKEQAKRHINNLKSEISVLKKLNHPNIIKYYSFDISPDNQTVEIVFELIEDGSLKDYLMKNGPLNETEASRFCKQILQGLDYLHEKSIIHRDLKCANILIGKNQVVKITDFGTAKQIKVKSNQDIAKLCASLKGTPYYMAPEILKRSGHHKSADIWSFGCTLIEILTGKPPWTTLTQNFQEIISYIISGIPPPLPPNISKECQFFLQSCFDIVPSQRLTARELLNHRFILNNTKVTSPSLVYEKFTPINDYKSVTSNTTRKNADLVQVTQMDSAEITRRKRSTKQDIFEKYSQVNSQNAFKKQNLHLVGKTKKSNMFSESPKFNQKSEPFLNYYGQQKYKEIQISQPYLSSKQQVIKKPKKGGNSDLKKVAKTVGHVKMTEDNLLDWNQIEQQMLSNQRSQNCIQSQNHNSSVSNTYAIQNTRNTKLNTQNSQQRDQIISTTLANEQRNRYIQNQKRQRQRKQDQKQKWQEELKKQSQTKRQISQRFIRSFQ